jgi:hypothetical protein
MVTLKIINEIHRNAVEKGFWAIKDFERSKALINTELSEAVEAARCDNTAKREEYAEEPEWSPEIFEKYIKDTFADEVADTVIRLCDTIAGFCTQFELNYIIEMVSREKCTWDSFFKKEQNIYKEINNITSQIAMLNNFMYVPEILIRLYRLAEDLDIDLDFHIQEKMKYNTTRAKKHGKLF